MRAQLTQFQVAPMSIVEPLIIPDVDEFVISPPTRITTTDERENRHGLRRPNATHARLAR
jgi:hypothetical protein